MFHRTEWLTKSQIQSFFSRLSRKTKESQVVMTEDLESESEDDYLEEYACQEDENHLIDTRRAVVDKIGLSYPSPMTYITFVD